MIRQAITALRTALRSITASPVVQLVAISTIAVALMVLGAVELTLYNLDRLVDRWAGGADLVAFAAGDTPDDVLPALADRIAGWPEVETATPRTRAEALVDLRRAFATDPGLLDGVDPAVVPAVIEIGVAPAHRTPDGRAALTARLTALPAFAAADAIDDGADLVARLERLRGLARAAGAVMAALALLAVVFIISNTIRLTLYARREELEILRLVGATDAFIRAPCAIEGAVQGAAGAAAATLALWALTRTLPLAELLGAAGPIEFLPPATITLGVLGAAAVGVIASHLATGRFLRPAP